MEPSLDEDEAELIDAFEKELAKKGMTLSDVVLQMAHDRLEEEGRKIAKRRGLPTDQSREALIALASEEIDTRRNEP